MPARERYEPTPARERSEPTPARERYAPAALRCSVTEPDASGLRSIAYGMSHASARQIPVEDSLGSIPS